MSIQPIWYFSVSVFTPKLTVILSEIAEPPKRSNSRRSSKSSGGFFTFFSKKTEEKDKGTLSI